MTKPNASRVGAERTRGGSRIEQYMVYAAYMGHSIRTGEAIPMNSMEEVNTQETLQEAPAPNIYIPPSIYQDEIFAGKSYTHFSALPKAISADISTEVVVGVDEAGRGPVLGNCSKYLLFVSHYPNSGLGPMVYSLFFLPLSQHRSLLAEKHRFDDSKVLTPIVRARLMELLCEPETDLYENCGWATRTMSARDISAGMLKPAGAYNLNAQAMDATIDLIKGAFSQGLNVREIYIDTIGSPQVYQKKLEWIFPATSITVAKKADSLYPCVSAASVCAKVTRDAALEVCYHARTATWPDQQSSTDGWGSGYPSDGRCTSWLKTNMDPIFGWGNECRFSWGTAKDMLETKGTGVQVDWPLPDEDVNQQSTRMTSFFFTTNEGRHSDPSKELTSWFGRPLTEETF